MSRLKWRQLGMVAAFVLVSATLVMSQLSAGIFLRFAVACFAAAALIPFVRGFARGLDAGEAIYFFVLYFILAMGGRAAALLNGQESIYLASIQDPSSAAFQGLMGWMLFLSALGLAALYSGYDLGLGRRLGTRLASWLDRGRPWRPGRGLVVGSVWLVVGFFGAALFASSLGGFRAAAQDLVNMATEGAIGRFWQIALMEFAVVGFQLVVLSELVRPCHRVRWLLLLPLSVVMVGLLLFTGSKLILLKMLATPLICFHFLRRKVSLVYLLLLFVGLAALFPFFYAYRDLGFGNWGQIFERLQDDHADSWFAAAPVLGRAYGADSFAVVLHETGQTVPFRFGASFLDLLTFWVPRVLWSGKPPSYSLVFADHYFGNTDLGGMSYVSPSLPGELYLNFHVPGILVGMFAFGIVLRAAHRVAIEGRVAGAFLYGYFFLFVVHMVEGSVAAQIELLLLDLVPAWLALRLLQRGAVPPARPGPTYAPSDGVRLGAPGGATGFLT